MNKQELAWEREYKNPKLVSKKDNPQADTLRFFKFLKKERKFLLDDLKVLDLGCGTGRNSNYLASLDNNVVGIEFSKSALNLAKERAKLKGLNVDYRLGSIGRKYAIDDLSIDLVLDVTSSNSLDEKERDIYLKEVFRVLKPGGYFFVRALAKEGNKNVKNLLKQSPGKEKDTYILKEMGLTERVFTRKDFTDLYSKYFEILKMDKKTNYSKFNGIVYKRDYLIVYLRKN
jgi:SAM-dependent methyltransferase